MTAEQINISKIWRYMAADHALADLQVPQLHFTRVDKFDDEWEGFAGSNSVGPVPTVTTYVASESSSGVPGIGVTGNSPSVVTILNMSDSSFRTPTTIPNGKEPKIPLLLPPVMKGIRRTSGKEVSKIVAGLDEKEATTSLQEIPGGGFSGGFNQPFYTGTPKPQYNLLVRESYFASCWSTVGPDSMQMWNAFTKGKSNWIALETTFLRLQRALPDTHMTLRIGLVAYFPEPFDPMPLEDAVNLLFRKRDAFSFEREVRVVVAPSLEKKPSRSASKRKSIKLSLKESYVTKMILHPRMDESDADRISKLVELNNLGFEVTRSAISRDPK